ncbi:MAG: DUF4440 domain-containing protein [Gemmatimonadales bacterium]
MRTVTLLASAVLVACQSTETADQIASRIEQESQAARAEIERIIVDYERWVAGGHVDSMASLLAEDARVLPPNQPSVVGRADWIAWARPMFAHGTWTEDIMTEAVVANGPIAIERGRYVLNFTPGSTSPAGAVAMSDTGKYLWHWHRIDGRWQLADAIWNSDRPLP